MKFSCETSINLPRERVVALFSDPEMIPKWQKGFLRMDYVSGEKGKPGNIHNLVFQQGRKEVTMVETIEVNDLPDRFVSTNTSGPMWNRIENLFTETENGTIWRMKAEFRGTGLFRLLLWLRPGMFRKHTLKSMNDFKVFAESL